MTMGTSERSHSRTLTRSTKRDVLILGLTGAVFALLAVMVFSSAEAWYQVLGACALAIMSVVNVSKAIIALRRDDYANASGSNGAADHGADVKVLDGATYTVVKRSSPAAGQGSHYWLGDNGQEIELTQEEASRLL